MPLSYSDHFRTTRMWSHDLQNRVTYSWMKAKGFVWVRRLDHRRFEQIVRNPTVGCYLELCAVQQVGCVPLDSAQAKRWIWRQCYF